MKPNEIKVLDLGEAAALLSTNYELIRLDKASYDWQRAFIFDDPDRTAFATLSEYRAGKLDVDALDYYQCTKTLKHRIRDNREGAL